MSAQKRKEEINLLPEKGFESTTTGRVLAWILSTFRVIVIVTEIIVMVAFLSRFWLDAQNSDLNEKIEQRQAVLSASQTFEKQFKTTQKRLEIYSTIDANQLQVVEVLKQISESLPPDVLLTTITLTNDKVDIIGNTPSEKSIQQLAINLEATNNIELIKIISIKTSRENSSNLEFNLSGIITKI